MLPGWLSNYYILILALQGICVWHSIRRGNQSKWIWIIVFLPVIGCLAYLFSEIITKRKVATLQLDMVNMINPGGRLKQLERRFKFSDTVSNRIQLANAYLTNGFYDRAISLYESVLHGAYQNDELVLKKLMEAYYEVGRYDDLIQIAHNVKKTLYFSKSKANLVYALALEKTGKADLAEIEFKAMNHRFSNFEARYYYCEFLLRQQRPEDADKIFKVMQEEFGHMAPVERREVKSWIEKMKEISKKSPVSN